MQFKGLIYTTEFHIKDFMILTQKVPYFILLLEESKSSLKKKKSNILPGSEWKEPLVLCKPLVGHCSLFHQEEFWLAANPFFVRKLTKSV